MKTYSRRDFISTSAMSTLAAMYFKSDMLLSGATHFN